MPVADINVYLFEVLEVRGAPLIEPELWGVAHQTAQVLRQFITPGEGIYKGGPSFVITPDTLAFTHGGGVQISNSSNEKGAYTAPEMKQLPEGATVDMEKILVYSLGKTLLCAAEYGLTGDKHPRLSGSLRTLLNAMNEGNPSRRANLFQTLEACCLYAEKHPSMKTYSSHVRSLYNSIMGNGSEEESVQTDENSRHTGSWNRENRANRSRGKHKYSNRREQQPSKLRSRSRSRSRHRSGNEDTDSGYPSSHTTQNREAALAAGYKNGFAGQGIVLPPPYTSTSFSDSSPDSTVISPSMGRSYHLSDITFSSSQNGGVVKQTSPSNGTLHSPRRQSAGSNMGTTAYEKYLKIKERQRKLKVLRRGLIGEGIDEDEPITLSENVDHQADTRSIGSSASYAQGTYLPGLHMSYGSDLALRMGRSDSDRESIVSSEYSVFQQDPNAMRSTDQGQYPTIERVHKARTRPSPQKPREYYGPEFVEKLSKPIIRVPIPLQGESLKNPSHARRVVIVLLTGQKLEAMCDPSTTGQQLYESVITHIELPEFFFFGLTYVNDGEHFFIEPDMKLHKVAPDGWKEGWKGNMPTITFTIYLRLKFYPDNLLLFRHQVSRHLLYLQLRHDILEERTMCSEDKAMALTGLALQAEYGDYDKETMGRTYFTVEHYYPNRVTKRVGLGYLRDNTPEIHEKYRGLSETKAQIEFIRLAQQLPEYGVHFYKLLKNKNDTNSIMWIGINVKCMVLAENQGYQRTIDTQHAWHMIQKISFNKRRFSIQPKPDLGQGKPVKLNYFTNSYRKGRYLLQFSTVQHRFQMKMKAREAQIDPNDTSLDAESSFEGPAMVDMDEEDMQMGHSSPQGSQMSEEDQPPSPVAMAIREPVPYVLPPPYKADTSVSMMDLRDRYAHPTHRRQPGHAASTGNILEEVNRDTAGGAFVLEVSSPSQELAVQPQVSEGVNDHSYSNGQLSPEFPDRQMFEVILEKDINTGFGITIVGSEATSKLDLGVYVKSVAPGGPAFKDGRIKPGDRLLAINDNSLEGLQHHRAVQMIRESGQKVKLRVSQVKCPGSIRRKDYDDFAIQAKLRESHANPSDVHIYRQISHDSEYSEADMIHVNEVSHVCTVNTSSLNDPDLDDLTNVDIVNSCEEEENIPVISHIPRNTVQPHPECITTAADVNTMSQVDSINTEMAVSDLPLDQPDVGRDDTDIESELESEVADGGQLIVEQVVESRLMPHDQPSNQSGVKQKTSPQNRTDDLRDGDSMPVGEIYQVTLKKKDNSFGLNVTGGVNTSVRQGGIFVKSLIPGGSAEIYSNIMKGDRILEVDGIALVGMTHRQAVETLCRAPSVCRMVLERGQPVIPKDSPSKTPPVVIENMLIAGDPNGVPSRTSSGSGSRSPVRISPKVIIDTEFVIAQGHHSNQGSDDLQVMSSGDEKITGSSESDVTTATVLEVTRSNVLESAPVHPPQSSSQRSPQPSPVQYDNQNTDDDLSQELESQKRDADGQYYPFVTADNTFEVNLTRGSSGLGFSVQDGQNQTSADPDMKGAVCIKKVFPIGPAAESGKLRSGDVLLEVNNVPVKGKSVTETLAILRAATHKVNLLICRQNSANSPVDGVEKEDSLDALPVNFSNKSASTSRPLRSPYETESEDEPILYRDSCITPPSEFASPRGSDRDSVPLPRAVSPPPPLPFSAPPSMQGTGTWPVETSEDESSSYDLGMQRNKNSDSVNASDDSNVNSPLKESENEKDRYKRDLVNNQHELGSSFDQVKAFNLTQTSLNSTGYDAQSELSRSASPERLTGRSEDYSSLQGSLRSVQEESEDESELSEDKDPVKPGELDVTLDRDERQGFGFTLAGGTSADVERGCFIRGIIQDPALSDGRLKAGDKLIKVNGKCVDQMNRFELITYLRQAPQLVRLRVFRESLMTANVKKSGKNKVIRENTGESDTETISQGEAVKKTDALFSFLEGHDKSQDEPHSESEEAQILSKRSSTGEPKQVQLLSPEGSEVPLTSGEYSQDAQGSSEYTDSQSASEKVSDFSQNAMQSAEDSLCSIKEEEVSPSQSLERTAPPAGSETENTSSAPLFNDSVGLLKIQLDKPVSGELGIGLVTAEKDNQTGVFVRSVMEGSVAHKDGRLHIMDRILQINGESTVGMTHSKAAAMLKKIQGRVTLTVSRLTSRQLEVMTPPVIMEEEEEENDSRTDEEFGTSSSEYLANSKGAENVFLHELSDHSEFDTDEEDMNALVVEAEKLLAAEETIELEPHELELSEIASKSEDHKWADNSVLSDDECSKSEKQISSHTFVIDAIARKLDIQVPNVITDDWLGKLPLLSIVDDKRELVPSTLNQLQHNIEQDDPQEEYKELRHVKMTDACLVGKRPENKCRNRFRNVLPYDVNRVVLSGENSYINASHINVCVAEVDSHYIACQGPLPQTSEDFWQMIWEQEVSVIAMLTQDVESRKVKCHRYWPDSIETPLFICDSHYKVSLRWLQSTEHIDIRQIEVENLTSGERRTVHHVNYITWPDHGVPDSALPILQCVQLVHVFHKTGPIVVHCSAGIGRTGAFITIDLAMTQIEQTCKCDIFEIVKELRRQRQGMIQTKDQYMLCYCACIEALLSQTS